MEKLKEHFTEVIRNSTKADFKQFIGGEARAGAIELSAQAVAGQSRILAIEFKDWCDLNEEQQDELAERELSDAELWNIFLSQKQF